MKTRTNLMELSFDGHGINGPDEYRSRVATFTSAEAADKYGPLFAEASAMLAALRDFVGKCECHCRECVQRKAPARAILARIDGAN